MDCQEIKKYLYPFIDGELDRKRSLKVQAHLDSCPLCSLEFQSEKKIESVDWSFRTGLTTSAVLECNHNTGNIIHPDKYMETHPEFFPIVNGKRYFPKPNPNRPKDWNIVGCELCYTADGIVDEAAKNIIEYFDKYPDRYTYSLSVNDTGVICKCKKCWKTNQRKES